MDKLTPDWLLTLWRTEKNRADTLSQWIFDNRDKSEEAARREGERVTAATFEASSKEKPLTFRPVREGLDSAATPPAEASVGEWQTVKFPAPEDKPGRVYFNAPPAADAPDELVQRLKHHASNLGNPFAQKACHEAAARIEADARRIGELVGGHIDAQKQIGKATDRVEQLQKRVAKLEAALAKVQELKRDASPIVLAVYRELVAVGNAAADALKGADNG